jgi:hypothetical protein
LKASIVIRALGALLGFALLGSACGDPAHDDLVSSLGGEDPNVSPGPTHRPGQPCMACHGGRGPAKSQFAMAGTVFDIPDEKSKKGLAGVVVTLLDSTAFLDPNAKGVTSTTNSAGNFLLRAEEYTPSYPVHVSLSHPKVPMGGQTMNSHVGRDGSCADCHHDPVGTESPGHVFFAFDSTGLPPSQ